MNVNRRDFFKASTAVMAGVAAASAGKVFEVPSLISSAKAQSSEATGDPIHIGFLAALSGPDAGWGLPGLTGNQIYIDRVNAEGGLLLGSTRHPLKMFAFDDEAVGSKALQGAKQLVLENDVKFISAIGGAPADATHPFLSKKKVIYASLISTDIKPDRPYLIAGDVPGLGSGFGSVRWLGSGLRRALCARNDRFRPGGHRHSGD
jgi:branched-chain amino acid transport system substrate-binding protein